METKCDCDRNKGAHMIGLSGWSAIKNNARHPRDTFHSSLKTAWVYYGAEKAVSDRQRKTRI